jgi:hypothetical protein
MLIKFELFLKQVIMHKLDIYRMFCYPYLSKHNNLLYGSSSGNFLDIQQEKCVRKSISQNPDYDRILYKPV